MLQMLYNSFNQIPWRVVPNQSANSTRWTLSWDFLKIAKQVFTFILNWFGNFLGSSWVLIRESHGPSLILKKVPWIPDGAVGSQIFLIQLKPLWKCSKGIIFQKLETWNRGSLGQFGRAFTKVYKMADQGRMTWPAFQFKVHWSRHHRAPSPRWDYRVDNTLGTASLDGFTIQSCIRTIWLARFLPRGMFVRLGIDR